MEQQITAEAAGRFAAAKIVDHRASFGKVVDVLRSERARTSQSAACLQSMHDSAGCKVGVDEAGETGSIADGPFRPEWGPRSSC